MTTDIVSLIRLSDKLAQVIRCAKFIYGEKWTETKKETIKIINAYMQTHKKTSILSAAIEMASAENDERWQILLLAAAADEEKK